MPSCPARLRLAARMWAFMAEIDSSACMRSWLTSVAWGGAAGKENGSTVVWEAAKTPVHTPKPVTEALPSDSRHRHDLHALKARHHASMTR